MGFSIETSVPVITVFLQGILSFFSPCVFPLVPLYVSYLAGGARSVAEDGSIRYPRKRILINTLFFVLGISFTFFVLGLGFSTLGRFFSGNRMWFARISGIIMVLFGLYQLGVFGRLKTMEKEHRMSFGMDALALNPLSALVLGFTFSFAWTPCVGPALSSVLLMVSSTGSSSAGFALIGVYTAGFVLPFLLVGLFTGTVLEFFKKHQAVVKYTVKIGGVLLILMGIMTITGFMNGITSYLSSVGNGLGTPGETVVQKETEETSETEAATDTKETESKKTEADAVAAPDFTLVDQYGETHTLSDYQGKVVFLNFWATWCGPCKSEMPDIQKVYEEYGLNEEDLIILGVANPKTDEYPYNNDVTTEEVEQFLEDNGYSFPVVMDTTGEVLAQYGIRAFPTTFMIDAEGNVFGYVSGALTRDMMDSIIEQTITGNRVR